MKIELKKIHHSEQLSEETNAFTADLYINGIHAGAVSNRGNGGPTDYYPVNDAARHLVKEAEKYCQGLPPEKFTSQGKEYTIDMNLENLIDNLLHKHLQEIDLQKFRKKLEKATEQSIVVGIADQSFRTLAFKIPIGMLLVHPSGTNILKDVIAKRVMPNLKEGEVILNTNIPEQVLKDAGLTTKQYVSQPEPSSLKNAPKKKKGRGL